MPTAVVTGANSGIAHAFAKILINEVSIFDLTVYMSSLNDDQKVGLQGIRSRQR